jgi:hypothetical protein
MRIWNGMSVMRLLPVCRKHCGGENINIKMSHLTFLYLIQLTFFLKGSILYASPPVSGHRIAELVTAEQAMYEGRLPEAGTLLSRTGSAKISRAAAIWRSVLSARLLHDQGNPTAALSALNALEPGLRNRSEYAEVWAESYLEKARILRSLFWFDAFNRMNDSAGMVIRHYKLPDHLKSRYHLNRVMYLSMVLLHFKAGPDLDSMNTLLSAAPADERFLYKPALALSVRINQARNLDRTQISLIRDSLWSTIDLPEPHEGAYDRIALWRSVANMYLDELFKENLTDQERSALGNRALRCFDRALNIQANHYPGSVADRVTLLDLKSLVLNRIKRHAEGLELLRKSERLLESSVYDDPAYYYLHFMTANYKLQLMDRALSGRSLYRELLHARDRWNWLESHWEPWESKNVDSLGHYRFHYTMDPGAILAMICYRLYQKVPDAQLLDQAFAAQERSKYRKMRRQWKARFNIQEPSVPSLSVLRKQLSADEALISASDAGVYETSTYMLVITKDTVAFVCLYDSRSKITRTNILSEPSALFMDVHSFKRALHEAWQLVFQDIEPLIRNRSRLTVWPSGYLSGFNLELLVQDTTGVDQFKDLKMMRDRHRFHYDHSWMIGQMRPQLPRTSTDDRKIFIPDYRGTSLYRLRFFEKLGTDLSDRFGFRVFEGPDAAVDRFIEEAPVAGILHIAGHGYSDRMIPGEQYVFMDSLHTAGPTRLSAIHLSKTDMRAELAVLSICMGGIAEWSHQNPRNLAYWFSLSGVHSCIYSYWKLDDRSTARVLERFYTYLERGVWRYEALRLAQEDIRRAARTDEELNPVYWAGLTIIGEDGPVAIKRQGFFGGLIFFLVIILILGLIFIVLRPVLD